MNPTSPVRSTPFSPVSVTNLTPSAPAATASSPPPTTDFNRVIADFLRNSPDFAGMPQEELALVESLFQVTIQYRLITDLTSPQKRQLHQQLIEKREAVTAYCEAHQLSLRVDEGIPVIFQRINDKASECVQIAILEQKHQLIREWHGGIILPQLSEEAIERLYEECRRNVQLTKNIEAKISYLVDLAQLPPTIRERYGVSFVHSGNEETPFRLVVTDNILMGYAIYDLLFSIGIRSGDYAGARVFDLDKAQLEKLNDHLTNLSSWSDDFAHILGDLLGNLDEAERYIALAQKPVSEILRNPIRLSATVVEQLQTIEPMPCLLFNHLSLNLKEHPQREYLKAKFQEFFALERLTGANGRPKEFIHDDPYRANIGVEQLKKICPRLNKLLKFQQLVMGYTGASNLPDGLRFLETFGLPNELEVMRLYKVGILYEMARSVLGERAYSGLLDELDTGLSVYRGASLDKLEGKSLQLCEKLLRHSTGVFFKREQNHYEPSSEQLCQLYGGQRDAMYAGGQRHRNLPALFASLKASPFYLQAITRHPALVEGVHDLERELSRRLNEYHRLSPTGFFGREMVDEAIRYLEGFVARVVHASESQVTQESVERALIVLAGTVGADLSRGCTTGLAGRLNNVLLALTTSTGNDLTDHLKQFQRDCLDKVFEEAAALRRNTESSMTALARGHVAEFLGLTEGLQGRAFDRLDGRAAEMLGRFLQKYTSVTVYHKAREFLADKFWQLNRDNDDEGIYRLLADLGIEGSREQIDKNYRVNGDPANRWQYAFFQQDMPQYLAPFLIRQKFLFVKREQNERTEFQKEGESSRRAPGAMREEAPQQTPQQVVNRDRWAGQSIQSSLPDYHWYSS